MFNMWLSPGVRAREESLRKDHYAESRIISGQRHNKKQTPRTTRPPSLYFSISPKETGKLFLPVSAKRQDWNCIKRKSRETKKMGWEIFKTQGPAPISSVRTAPRLGAHSPPQPGWRAGTNWPQNLGPGIRFRSATPGRGRLGWFPFSDHSWHCGPRVPSDGTSRPQWTTHQVTLLYKKDTSIVTHLLERDKDPTRSPGKAQMLSFSGEQLVAFSFRKEACRILFHKAFT